MKIDKKTKVVPTRSGTYKAILDGKEISAEFNSKGAALAGIDVERRRRIKS